MVEQLLADPQPPAAAFPPTGTAAAAGLQPGSSGESSWGTQPAGAYAQAKEEAGFSSGELRVNSYGAAPSVGTPPLYGAPLPLYDTHSGGSDYGPAAPQVRGCSRSGASTCTGIMVFSVMAGYEARLPAAMLAITPRDPARRRHAPAPLNFPKCNRTGGEAGGATRCLATHHPAGARRTVR